MCIARSQAASENPIPTSAEDEDPGRPPKNGQFTCSSERSDHVLATGPAWAVDAARGPKVTFGAAREIVRRYGTVSPAEFRPGRL